MGHRTDPGAGDGSKPAVERLGDPVRRRVDCDRERGPERLGDIAECQIGGVERFTGIDFEESLSDVGQDLLQSEARLRVDFGCATGARLGHHRDDRRHCVDFSVAPLSAGVARHPDCGWREAGHLGRDEYHAAVVPDGFAVCVGVLAEHGTGRHCRIENAGFLEESDDVVRFGFGERVQVGERDRFERRHTPSPADQHGHVDGVAVDDVDEEAGLPVDGFHDLAEQRLDGGVEFGPGDPLELVGDVQRQPVERLPLPEGSFGGHPPQELPNEQAEPAQHFELVGPPGLFGGHECQGRDPSTSVVDGGDERLPIVQIERGSAVVVEQFVEWDDRMSRTLGEADACGVRHGWWQVVRAEAVSNGDRCRVVLHVVNEDSACRCPHRRGEFAQGCLEAHIGLSWVGVDQGGANGPQHLVRRTEPAHFTHRRPVNIVLHPLSEWTTTFRENCWCWGRAVLLGSASGSSACAGHAVV